jgi:hypothetical protein
VPVITPSGGAGGGSQPLLVATVPLSSAQILALHDSPIEIVPVQAGFVIWPVTASILYKAGTTPYDQHTGFERILWSGQNAPGDQVFEEIAGPGDAIVLLDLMKYFEGFDVVGNFGAVTIDNSIANPTGGDGTAVVTVWFVLVPVT